MGLEGVNITSSDRTQKLPAKVISCSSKWKKGSMKRTTDATYLVSLIINAALFTQQLCFHAHRKVRTLSNTQ